MDVSHIFCDVEASQESDLLLSLSNGERRDRSESEDEGDQMGHIIDVAQGDIISSNDHNWQQLPRFKTQNAINHLERYMAECSCANRCSFEGNKELSLSFAAMSESVRANTVRSMLFFVTEPADKENILGEWNTNYAQNFHLYRSVSCSWR